MDAEYIKREAALESLCTGCEYVPIEEKEVCPYRFTGCQEYANIFAIPAADVVPVVRCKECANQFDWPWCGMFPDDGYCSAGARMDGDEET